MRIVLVGPGAIGCAVAFRLAKSGHEVTLLDHNQDRAAHLSRHGLFVETDDGVHSVPIRAVHSAPHEPTPMLIFCVKAFDTDAAARRSQSAIGTDTTVVSLQNGIGNAERIVAATRVAPSSVVCAVTTMGSTSLGQGHVRLAGEGSISVAPFDPAGAPRAEFAAHWLEQAGSVVHRRDDVRGMIWGKAILNAAINPITALADVPNGGILDRPHLREQMIAAAREAQSVAQAAGIGLSYADAGGQAERVCLETRDNISSMLQDIRQGRRTEVDAITGAIVDEATRFGIDVPVNRELLERVHALERRGKIVRG